MRFVAAASRFTSFPSTPIFSKTSLYVWALPPYTVRPAAASFWVSLLLADSSARTRSGFRATIASTLGLKAEPTLGSPSVSALG